MSYQSDDDAYLESGMRLLILAILMIVCGVALIIWKLW